MSKAIHCDGPSCNLWAKTRMAKDTGFMFVHWDGSTWHFCSWDCVMRYAATREPLEIID